VKQAQQAEEQRDGCIEHVFGAADEVFAGDQRANQINGKKSLK
jgi:hypothetical protein